MQVLRKSNIVFLFIPLFLFTFLTAKSSADNEDYYIYLPVAYTPQAYEPVTPYERWANVYNRYSLIFVNDVVETDDGGFAITGGNSSEQYYPGRVAKLNQDGSIAWLKGLEAYASLSKIIVAPDGNIYAAGIGRYENIWIVKIKPDGTVEWQSLYGRDGRLGGVVISADNDFFLAGKQDYDAWVIKVNSDGSPAWEKEFGNGNDQFEAIAGSGDGGVIVAGQTTSFGADGWDGWLLKLNEDGNISWQRIYGSSEGEFIESIGMTNDGGYIVAGWVWDANGQDGWVMRLNDDGTVAWSKIIGGYDMDNLLSISQVSDGGFIASGWSQSFGSGYAQGWVLKISEDGKILWQRAGPISAIEQVNAGGYVTAGYYKGEILVLRLDEFGYIPDCNIIGRSRAYIRDHPVTLSISNATADSLPLHGGRGTFSSEDRTAVVSQICPASQATLSSCN